MRGKIFLAIASVFLFWMGGQHLYTALKNRQPTKLSIAAYQKAKPKAEWLELRGCALEIDAAMHSEHGGKIDELYVPVFDLSDETEAKVGVLLATHDAELIRIYQAMSKVKNEDEVQKLILANKDKLLDRTVAGVVRFGVDLKDSDRTKLASLDDKLSSDFIILEDGAKPRLGFALALLLGGLVCALILVASLRKRSVA